MQKSSSIFVVTLGDLLEALTELPLDVVVPIEDRCAAKNLQICGANDVTCKFVAACMANATMMVLISMDLPFLFFF